MNGSLFVLIAFSFWLDDSTESKFLRDRQRASEYSTSAFTSDQNIDSGIHSIDVIMRTCKRNHVRVRIVRIGCIFALRVRNTGIATHDAECFTLIRNESKMSHLLRRLIPNAEHLRFDCGYRNIYHADLTSNSSAEMLWKINTSRFRAKNMRGLCFVLSRQVQHHVPIMCTHALRVEHVIL